MADTDLRQEYFNVLLTQARGSPLPPAALLDRLEQAITDRGQAEEYVEFLLATVQRMPPCYHLLDRIARMVQQLELAAERRDAANGDGSPALEEAAPASADAPEGAPSAVPEPSLDMKKSELLALAEDRGIEVPSKATKKDIVALLTS